MSDGVDVARNNPPGYLKFFCPGCQHIHQIRVPPAERAWQWNGSLTAPTITPSIHVKGTVPPTDEEIERIVRKEPFEPKPLVCHSFVANGSIRFLDDCTHQLKGQTVALPPYPYQETP